MSELRIRNMDDWVVSELRARSKRHGRSLEAELRELLRTEAGRPRREAAERARELREAIAQEHGVLPDSSELIRDDRNSR